MTFFVLNLLLLLLVIHSSASILAIFFFIFYIKKNHLYYILAIVLLFITQFIHINKSVDLQENETILITVYDRIKHSDYSTSFIAKYNNNKFLVYIDYDPSIKYGDILSGGAFDFAPISNQYNNKVSFDTIKYYQGQLIFHKFNFDNHKNNGMNNNFIYKLKNFRSRQIEVINDKYENASYINALVFGHRNFDDSLNKAFSTTGIIHILSISGTHLIFILGTIRFILYFFNRSIFFNKIIQTIFIPLYFFLSGANIPIFRASIVQLITLHSKLKKVDILNSVVITMIFINPFIFYNVSFVLSFTIAYSLIYYKNKNLFPFATFLFLLLLPLTSNFNYIINIFTPLINIIIVPIVTMFILPLSFYLSIIKSDFLLASIFDIFIFILEKMIFFFTNFNIILGFVGPLKIVLMLFSLFVFIKYKNYFKSFFIILLVIFIPPLTNYSASINFLDVGQGDAVLITKPFNSLTILIDTGPPSSEFELDNYLLSRKIKTIDFLFISHFDSDHVGNLDFILQNYKVKNTYVSYIPEEYQHFNFILINEVTNFNLGGFDFTLFPPNKRYDNDNDNSLVVLFKNNDLDILFTGDIERSREIDMVSEISKFDIDILKVAHHGSKTSTDISFLSHFSPEYAIITAGYNNRYGHPHDDVVSILEKNNIIIFETAIIGEIKINIML